MWPWEHVLFAYLAYSTLLRIGRTRPTTTGTIALVFGAVLPDLIDKPLAWEFGLVPSGYGIAHSVLVVVPVCLLVLIVADRSWAAGFVSGLVMHLVGDVIPISVRQGELVVDHLLWPVATSTTPGPSTSFVPEVRRHLSGYLVELASLQPSSGLVVQLSLVIAGILVWVADGRPGWSAAGHAVHRSCRLVRSIAR